MHAIMQKHFLHNINPLVHSVHYIGRLTKVLILILEGILKKKKKILSVAPMRR